MLGLRVAAGKCSQASPSVVFSASDVFLLSSRNLQTHRVRACGRIMEFLGYCQTTEFMDNYVRMRVKGFKALT
jgi:hypothetical protein